MSSTMQLNISNENSYDDKCDIEIRLKKQMSSADYKIVVDAANTIIATTGKYITKPAHKEEK